MNRRCSFYFSRILLFAILLQVFNEALCQTTCINAFSMHTENFGMLTGFAPHADAELPYSADGYQSDASYRICNNTQQRIEWLQSTDHTGNHNGGMMVVNGKEGIFYSHIIQNTAGFVPGTYYFNLHALNIGSDTSCAVRKNPKLSFSAEYKDSMGNWRLFLGAPYKTAELKLLANRRWEVREAGLYLPESNTKITALRISLANATPAGCGNQFAVDDIAFFYCPKRVSLPVNFLTIAATQKDDGVAIKWTTAFEINNKYFELEKSTNGLDWQLIEKRNSVGNSANMSIYNAYDAVPIPGNNYYRVKQFDASNGYSLSETVLVRFEKNKNNALVNFNQQTKTLQIRYNSMYDDQLTVQIFNAEGLKVWSVKKSISAGDNLLGAHLSLANPGIYIVHITNQRSNSTIVNKFLMF